MRVPLANVWSFLLRAIIITRQGFLCHNSVITQSNKVDSISSSKGMLDQKTAFSKGERKKKKNVWLSILSSWQCIITGSSMVKCSVVNCVCMCWWEHRLMMSCCLYIWNFNGWSLNNLNTASRMEVCACNPSNSEGWGKRLGIHWSLWVWDQTE